MYYVRINTKILAHVWISRDSSANWKNLKELHSSIHKGVQKYIDEDYSKSSNLVLKTISQNIEKDIINVFDHLNIAKIENSTLEKNIS